MPFYKVFMHGEGIRVPGEGQAAGNQKQIVGFYTTRIAAAGSEEEASRTAVKKVERQWSSGQYASRNVGSPPRLTVESVQRVGLLTAVLFRATGHMFYFDEAAGA